MRTQTQSVLPHFTLSRSAPTRATPHHLAPLRFAPSHSALSRFAPSRSMLSRFALLFLAGSVLASGACRGSEDPNVVRLNGRLEAPTVDIAPKVPGRVLEVLVREGDRVKAGDVLIKLDLGETTIAVERDRAGVESAQARYRDLEVGSRAPDIRALDAQVADRRAAIDLARPELERQRFLLSRKVGTQREVDRAKTELERAEAALKVAQNQLQLAREGSRKFQTQQAREEVTRAQAQLRQSQTVAGESELRAPGDAIVLHRLVEPGQLLGAGTPGLTLAFTTRLYVRTFIPETKLGIVRQGQAAEVIVDAFPGRTFPARISEISMDAEFTPKAVETRNERVNLVYGAKADLDAGWKEPLVPGQPAEVTVRVQPAPAQSTASQPAASPPAPGK
jgi:HlyD family secretion protein